MKSKVQEAAYFRICIKIITMSSNTKEELKTTLKEYQDLDRVIRYIADLDAQIDEHELTVTKLENHQFKEFEDLQKLEGNSLKSVFYKVLGNKEQQLEKERQEHLQASMKYEAAKKSLDLLSYERGVLEKKLTDADILKSKIELLKKKRAGEIMASGSLAGQRMLEIVTENDAHRHLQNEIDEALSVGSRASDLLGQIVNNLRQASNWGQWDMSGRRRTSSYTKHSYIDRAKSLSHSAHNVLRQFEMELRDVYRQQNYGLDVEIASFSRFTDIFFDNLISDWVIQQKIQNSLSSVVAVRDKVNRLMGSLQADDNKILDDLARLESEYEALVMKG